MFDIDEDELKREVGSLRTVGAVLAECDNSLSRLSDVDPAYVPPEVLAFGKELSQLINKHIGDVPAGHTQTSLMLIQQHAEMSAVVSFFVDLRKRLNKQDAN